MTNTILKDTVFHVETRREAIEVLANAGSLAIHDHLTNSLVHQAASELIIRDDRGQKTDIRSIGLPHQVLSEVANELHTLGISMFASSQILEALESYTVGLGADFAREAQAKPLYARVVVTDKKPDDMPDCELVQTTLIDGQRRVGDGVSQRVMQSTIYGTRTSMTKEMNLDEMFASSRKKWLMIYYGSPSAETYKGLDSVDVSLINLIQGLGGKIPQTMMDEIQTDIQNGKLSPIHIEMIDSFAKIEKLLEPFSIGESLPSHIRTELSGLVSDISKKMKTIQDYSVPLGAALSMIARNNNIALMQPIMLERSNNAANDEHYISHDIAELVIGLERVIEDTSLPFEVRENIVTLLAEIKSANGEIGTDIALAHMVTVLVNIAAVETISLPLFQSISSVLPMIGNIRKTNLPATSFAQPEVLSVIELIRTLSQSLKLEQNAGDYLSPHMTGMIENLANIETLIAGKSIEETVRLFTNAIKNPASSPLSTGIQTLILSLVQPQTQTVLQSLTVLPVKEDISRFISKNSELIDYMVTSMMIQDIEIRLAGIEPSAHNKKFSGLPSMEPAELKKILDIIKLQGIYSLLQPDHQAAMTPPMKQAVNHFMQNHPVIAETALSVTMIREIEKIPSSFPIQNQYITPAERQMIIHALQTGGISTLVDRGLSDKLGDNAKNYVAALTSRVIVMTGRNLQLPITSDIIQHYDTRNSSVSQTELTQDSYTVAPSKDFHTNPARQDRKNVATLTKILSEPSENISARHYEKNLELLNVINTRILMNPELTLKQNIAEMIKSPAGLTDVTIVTERLKSLATDQLPLQERKSIIEIKQAVLEARTEYDLSKNLSLSEEVKGQVIRLLETMSNPEETNNPQKTLNTINKILETTGTPPPDALKDLRTVIEQKAKIEAEQITVESPPDFSPQLKSDSQPQQQLIYPDIQNAIIPDYIPPEIEPTENKQGWKSFLDKVKNIPSFSTGDSAKCPSIAKGGPCCGCCAPEFKKASALQGLIKDIKESVLGKFDSLTAIFAHQSSGKDTQVHSTQKPAKQNISAADYSM